MELKVNTFKKACVAVYPSTVQHDIVWFWPNSDPRYKDIIMNKKPPYIPELDDPSFIKPMGNREIPCSYEVQIQNLTDPAHLPYAHYGIMPTDREGGGPVEPSIKKLDIDGFLAKQERGISKFMPPCIFCTYPEPPLDPGNGTAMSDGSKMESSPPAATWRMALILICIPVSPGNCRLIWTCPRNFRLIWTCPRNYGVWIDQVVPRWIFHVGPNLLVDSDLPLLHVEEKKIMEVGTSNWQKARFLPAKLDALVFGFRKWLNKYAGGQADWRGKFSGSLPAAPPREPLMDRYWSHVVNCRSCNDAYKGLNTRAKQNALLAIARTTFVVMAVLFFGAS
ncbi:hypothetical protein EUGRSUZ_J01820 [Eucalyptus grandis]|uniref:Uncharacterized protein n=2 Tax=Eucalyptus grandis TaxID=71139 RepID=A0ACC3J7X5_EUCGR|nr:hypothetical protein EUGRSUZ_J01820 [Eucalyptus grandis]